MGEWFNRNFGKMTIIACVITYSIFIFTLGEWRGESNYKNSVKKLLNEEAVIIWADDTPLLYRVLHPDSLGIDTVRIRDPRKPGWDIGVWVKRDKVDSQ